ncbi:MAG TPA: hypothetical protein VLQ47_11370 [Rhodoferax sp.]|nr:hypothetical protein [Rhodoferax sp.]
MARVNSRVRAIGLLVCAVAAALWLGWTALERNLQQACQWQQWPYLNRCADPARQPVAQQVQALREQIAANPGDALSYAALATFSDLPQGIPGLDSAAVLAAASQLAPQNRYVLRLLANQYLLRKQWPEAADALVRLSLLHGDGEATRALAAMVGQSGRDTDQLAALVALLKTDAGWLERVLHSLPAAKVPVVQAMPLVQQAMALQLLTPELGMVLIRQLMAEGVWLDAHAIWLHLWKRPLGLLFNGDFEQDFVKDGFDWNITDSNSYRAGARVQLPRIGERGRLLQVEFTGRAIAQPVLSQPLVLAPGNYRLSGDYKASNLRSNEGLAWVFACAADRRELGRSSALKNTGGRWEKFTVELTVPGDCGVGVSLSLQTFARYEAATGLRGEMLVDKLALHASGERP